jgi:hypothetical protein
MTRLGEIRAPSSDRCSLNLLETEQTSLIKLMIHHYQHICLEFLGSLNDSFLKEINVIFFCHSLLAIKF